MATAIMNRKDSAVMDIIFSIKRRKKKQKTEMREGIVIADDKKRGKGDIAWI